MTINTPSPTPDAPSMGRRVAALIEAQLDGRWDDLDLLLDDVAEPAAEMLRIATGVAAVRYAMAELDGDLDVEVELARWRSGLTEEELAL